jgi:hypothetical protein
MAWRLVRPPLGARPRVVVTRPVSPSIATFTRRQSGIALQGGWAQTEVSGGGAQVSAGPQGAGTVWYPAQVTVSTTTGIATGLDTSVCNVYLGAAGTPTTLQGTIYGGNGVLAVALPPLTVGLFLIAVWTGAHNGDQAAMNITGTMDALA